MHSPSISALRLSTQRLAAPDFDTPEEVVSWFGAVQAQDFAGALRAVGMRTRSATEERVEQAIAGGRIVRTWPMRGTLHFVAPADIRWMLELLAPRVIATHARRLKAEYNLDEQVLDRSAELIVGALSHGRRLARNAMYQVLESAGVAAAGQRGLHILGLLAQKGLICFGPREGRQQTFVLVDDWVPAARSLEREEALARLALLYFRSHGPATLKDFAWWSGLKLAETREAVALAEEDLARETIDGEEYRLARSSRETALEPCPTAHLLPVYDEYTVAYKDRSAVLRPEYAARPDAGKGIFFPPLVIDGQIVGTWRRTLARDTVMVSINPFDALTERERSAVEAAAERYGRFLELKVVVE